MPIANINGAQLTYQDRGQGQPVVFLHGSLADYRTWDAQVEPFARHFRVITYSRRYHWPNPWPPTDIEYSASLHAQDLNELLACLEIGQAHIIGSSYGAYIALLFARDHPSAVRSLALGEPPLVPWLAGIPGGMPLGIDFIHAAWEPARRAFAAGDAAAGVGAFLAGVTAGSSGGAESVSPEVLGATMLERMPADARAMVMDNAPEMAFETRSMNSFPPFSCADAAGIDLPALVLSGARSPTLFHLIGAELAHCLPQAQRVTVPRAGHTMHAGNPAAYNRAVLAFLRQVSA